MEYDIDVLMSNFAGMFGTIMKLPVAGGKTYYVLPHGAGDYGNDVIDGHVAKYKPDYVLTLIDHFVLKDWGSKRGFKWIPLTPIDCSPPLPKLHYESLKNAYHIVPYSHYTEELLKTAFNPRLITYIPHSIDTSVYAPKPQALARAEIQCPDQCFIYGMVAANLGYPNRKGIPQSMAAFRLCKDAGLKDIRLFIHTALRGDTDLIQMRENFGLSVEDVIYPDQYAMMTGMMQDPHMVNTFNSFDVLLAPARGEGFGLPLLEGQACGIPAITSDHSSMTELCFGGWCLKPGAHSVDFKWANMADPDPEAIAEAMYAAYYEARTPEWQERKRRAREGALQYDHSVVWPKLWHPFLDMLADNLKYHQKRWDMGLKVPGEGMIP